MSAFSKRLREKRLTLANEATALLDKAEKEKRELSVEESASFDKIHAEIEELRVQVEKAEKQDAVEFELAGSAGIRAGRQDSERVREPSADEKREKVDAENRAFDSWLRHGEGGMTPEDRTIMIERRAQSTVNASGGYTVAPEFYHHLEEAMKAYGGMIDASTTITTDTGATLPMPTENDTTNSGVILAENVQATTQDDVFGVINVGAFMYTSKIVLVSLQLLQDSAFDIGAFLAKKCGIRIARAQNAHFTTGTGASQPNGVVTAAVSGTVGAVGQTLTVIFDDLINLVHSVDPAYRKGASFMMSDSSLKVIKKLKDTQNRPLWIPGGIYAGKEPDTINGYPYIINQDMAAMAANAKSILFGDLSKYFIRRVKDTQVLALRERYADFAQVGFVAFARADGNLLDAGTNPVKYYANSAT